MHAQVYAFLREVHLNHVEQAKVKQQLARLAGKEKLSACFSVRATLALSAWHGSVIFGAVFRRTP